MSEPLRIAVVGHTNVGKTSLLRTLTRRVDFGEVADRPGTTRHVERVDLQVDGRTAMRFLDTPGLEDAVALRHHIDAANGVASPDETPAGRIRRFLGGPEAHGVFEQEAKVLRTVLDVDAAFLVIDTREPLLPKFRAEIELLASCARPVLPVLNFLRDADGRADSRETPWRELLSAYGLHVVVRFDAAAPFVGGERELYRDLGTLLQARREALAGIGAWLEAEAMRRRHAAAICIADLAVDVAAMRRTASAADFADTGRRATLVSGLRRDVFDRAQVATSELIALYGFREDDAAEAPLAAVEGRWTLDLFEPAAMKAAGLLFGKGVAVGVAVGVVADLALAGLSLGAGVALGGAVGAAVSQGWGPLGRKVLNRLRDVQELSVEDGVLALLIASQLRLLHALERRGHAATGTIDATGTVSPGPLGDETQRRVVVELVRAVRPARSHPGWERRPASRHGLPPDDQRRDALVREVALRIEGAADHPAIEP